MKLGLFNKIRKALRPGAFRRKVIPYLWYYLGPAALVRLYCRTRRVKRGKIVFNNFHGCGFGDHQKYIALELLRRKSPVEIVWLAADPATVVPTLPPNVRVAGFSPLKAIGEMATAQFWCSNQSLDKFIVWGLFKKPGQCYIQTFHGSLGIKRVGADIPSDGSVQLWLEMLKRDAKMIDYLISNARWESEFVYARRFFGKGETREFGHPRNDVFFGGADSFRAKVRSTLGLSASDRIVLYAPTHRRGGGTSGYLLEFGQIIRACEHRFGGTWKAVVRLHPNMLGIANRFVFDAVAVDATRYDDIQELLVGSDALISDYSSCMFDFMLSRRPVFVYASDLEQYERERGLYYPMSETPFPVAKDEAGLRDNIRGFDDAKYRAGVEEFLKGKGCVEDGHAAERVVELIERKMKEA